VADPRASLDSIGRIIIKDQSLTSRFLKLSNSAFYGFPRKIDSVQEALQLIGIQQIRDLAMATSRITVKIEFFGLDTQIS
jgi:HD-like signal output (HDOD) protein